LNEGALWVEARVADEYRLNQAVKVINQKMMQILETFPEVKQTLAQVGRTNDGTDPKGFFNVQIQVDLLPKKNGSGKITEES
jgi:cobalt-zinc-cadmium resistance protein CzcA